MDRSLQDHPQRHQWFVVDWDQGPPNQSCGDIQPHDTVPTEDRVPRLEDLRLATRYPGPEVADRTS